MPPLRDRDAKAYLLVFRTGEEVMEGLPAFARKHELVTGHLTGIGTIRDTVIGCFDPRKRPVAGQRLSFSSASTFAFASLKPAAAALRSHFRASMRAMGRPPMPCSYIRPR